MGSRYSVLVASGQVSLEAWLNAVGAVGWETLGEAPAPVPVGGAPPDESWLASGSEWTALVLGYCVGATRRADASEVAAALSPISRLAYFGLEDTNREISAQVFENGQLIYSHFEQAGEVDASRSVGVPPAKNRYDQTDTEALLQAVLPAGTSLGDFERQLFSHGHIRWRSEQSKKRWWQWR
jgi:hypothetical protein